VNGTALTHRTPGINVPAITPGLAEQLARIAHFRALHLPEVDELDPVAFHLIGKVGSLVDQAVLWERLQEDAIRLWHLLIDDWDDRDLDELTEDEWRRLDFQTQQAEIDHRYTATRARLAHDIEQAVWLARYRHAEATARTSVTR
jgi:hypothetical protein